jgi:primosomal protein N' (replication factor Y)
VRREAEQVARQIRAIIQGEGLAEIDPIGPAPAFRHKIRGRYRWQIILRGRGLAALIKRLNLPPGWTVDVDPMSTL